MPTAISDTLFNHQDPPFVERPPQRPTDIGKRMVASSTPFSEGITAAIRARQSHLHDSPGTHPYHLLDSFLRHGGGLVLFDSAPGLRRNYSIG